MTASTAGLNDPGDVPKEVFAVFDAEAVGGCAGFFAPGVDTPDPLPVEFSLIFSSAAAVYRNMVRFLIFYY